MTQTSPTDNREHIAAKLSELFNAHKLEVDPFPALADWCISEIDKARADQIMRDGLSLALDGDSYNFADEADAIQWREDRLQELEVESLLIRAELDRLLGVKG